MRIFKKYYILHQNLENLTKFFGSVGRAASSFSTLIISVILTVSTICIYHITYNLFYLAIAVTLIFLIANVSFRKR
jgi:hypothetical protein